MDLCARVIGGYVHNGRIGVLVELALQTEASGQMTRVSALAKDLAIHIAASDPTDIEDLLSQPFVKEPSKTIGELVSELSEYLHENVAIARFIRWDTEPELPQKPEEPPNGPAVALRLRSVK